MSSSKQPSKRRVSFKDDVKGKRARVDSSSSASSSSSSSASSSDSAAAASPSTTTTRPSHFSRGGFPAPLREGFDYLPTDAQRNAEFVADALKGKKLVLVKVPRSIKPGALDGTLLTEGPLKKNAKYSLVRDDGLLDRVALRALDGGDATAPLFSLSEAFTLVATETDPFLAGDTADGEEEKLEPIRPKRRGFPVPPGQEEDHVVPGLETVASLAKTNTEKAKSKASHKSKSGKKKKTKSS